VLGVKLVPEMAKLPPWAQAPKGKGVTEKLRSDLMTELRDRPVPDDFARQRSWQGAVLALIAFDPELAKRLVTKVVDAHNKRYSKVYSIK
jgi:hypothetical protein